MVRLLKNDNLSEYLHLLFADVNILEEKNIEYVCDCSKERFMRNLLTLPKKDLIDLSNEDSFEIKCEFCNKVYKFDKQDIQTVLKYANR